MSRGATVPVNSSSRSESVVLPWSTCAITEMARISDVGVGTVASLLMGVNRPAGGSARGSRDPPERLAKVAQLTPPPTFHAVSQDHVGHLVDLGDPDLGDAVVGGQRLGCLSSNQVRPMTIDLQADVQLSQRPKDWGGHDDRGKPDDRICDSLSDLRVLLPVSLAEATGVGFPLLPPLHDLDSLADILDPLHVDGQPEPVQQLRTQVALLRIHGPDQDEAGRMPDGNALPLNHVDAHSGGV